MKNRSLKLLGALFVALITLTTNIQPLFATNLLIATQEKYRNSIGGEDRFYVSSLTENGDLSKLPSIPRSQIGDSFWGRASDLTVTTSGTVAFQSGRENPRINLLTGTTWTTLSTTDWGVGTNGTFGGIVAVGNDLYTTDMTSATIGVIHFQEGGGVVRTPLNFGAKDVAYHNSELYLLNGDGSPIREVYVLNTNSGNVRKIEITFDDHRAITVAPDGSFFTATWDGHVNHFDSEGNFIKYLSVGIPRWWPDPDKMSARFSDIDISPDGKQLALGTADGFVVLADTNLGAYSYQFVLDKPDSDGTTFVAWDTRIIPEPAVSGLTFMALCLVMRRKKE